MRVSSEAGRVVGVLALIVVALQSDESNEKIRKLTYRVPATKLLISSYPLEMCSG